MDALEPWLRPYVVVRLIRTVRSRSFLGAGRESDSDGEKSQLALGDIAVDTRVPGCE